MAERAGNEQIFHLFFTISQLLAQLISELKTVPLKECYEDQ